MSAAVSTSTGINWQQGVHEEGTYGGSDAAGPVEDS